MSRLRRLWARVLLGWREPMEGGGTFGEALIILALFVAGIMAAFWALTRG